MKVYRDSDKTFIPDVTGPWQCVGDAHAFENDEPQPGDACCCGKYLIEGALNDQQKGA